MSNQPDTETVATGVLTDGGYFRKLAESFAKSLKKDCPFITDEEAVEGGIAIVNQLDHFLAYGDETK